MQKTLYILSLLLLLVSCNSKKQHTEPGYETTASGISYRIISSAEAGETIGKGDVVKLHLNQFLDDSLMNSTYNRMPEYVRIDSSLREFDYSELLPKMKTGDSAIAIFSVKEILRRAGKDATLPDFMKKGKQVIVRFKVLGKFPSDSTAVADYSLNQARIDALDSVIQKEGYAKAALEFDSLIRAQKKPLMKLEPGLYLEMTGKGTGPKIIKGMEIALAHKGYLANGKLFESTNAANPFILHAGNEESIEGVDKAILQLSVGDKARVFIAAPLGFGPKAKGDDLPAFSNLVFEIDIIKNIEKN